MNRSRKKTISVLAMAGAMIGVMTGLVIYSPTLYQAFCNMTGYGGTVRRSTAPTTAASKETLTISFDANVAPGLEWDFRPEQRNVTTHFDEPTKIYYYARNNSDHTVVARATYNITPYKAAPYFFKIQCFCFTKEKLAPGQSARMPVVLYVDKQLLKDPNASEVRDITLSYTFFKQPDESKENLAAARDLSRGSKAEEAELGTAKNASFDNDAPRQ